MYSSGYSQVNKFSPEAKKKMQYRSKGKSCGYYMRIIFFFSSLIQSLIIVSLVLFLIYGKTQDSASSDHDQDLEKRFSQISMETVALRQQRKNLTNLLNTTLTEKAKNDWDLANLKILANRSVLMFQHFDWQLRQCTMELTSCKVKTNVLPHVMISQPPGHCNCGLLVQQMKAGLQLLESNLTATKQTMTMEKEKIAKERDNLILEAIRLRREKSTLKKELEIFRQTSKDEFSELLAPVSNVSKAFLKKIDSLFPKHIAFQLTCPKQKEHLQQIHTNCTSLSWEVENKLQRYLDIVGDQVSNLQIENNHLKAENWRLSEDYRWCSQNRTGIIEQHQRSKEEFQQKLDQEKERHLMEKMKLTGENKVLTNSVKYKDAEVDHLKAQLNQLNMSCMARNGFGGYPGGGLGSQSSTQNQFGVGSLGGGGSSYSSSSSSSLGQGRTGTAGLGSSFSSGSGFNRAGTTGASSSSSFPSSGSRSILGSTGSGFNQQGSAGAGSSSSTFQQPGSSPSLNGVGSGMNKPASTGGAFTNFGSFGSSLGLSGTGLNNPALSGKSSPGLGSSSVSSKSSSSTSKTSSPGLSLFGFGSSNSGQSKTGSVPVKTSPGSGSGGTGSAFGGGRTNGQADGSAIARHIQDLQHLINPPAPQEKQDLSRMMG